MLVIGGTGMLRPAVDNLLVAGSRVIAVARRPFREAPADGASGEYVPVVADWSDPATLAQRVADALSAPTVSKVIAWIHSPYQQGVTQALSPLLSADSIVVRLWGSAGADPRDTLRKEGPILSHVDVRTVILGYQRDGQAKRWLTDEEISDGALAALSDPQSPQVVGVLDPW